MPTIPALASPLRAVLRAAVLPVLALSPLAQATDWAAAARQDLQFAADTLRARHAGVALGQPSVTVPLDTGYRNSMAEAAAVRTEQDYLRLMSRFFAGFGDPHTAIGLRLRTSAWTGLVLDLVDGRYRVAWSEPGWPAPLPPVGAIAQQCDDAWIATYLQVQVAPFVNEGAEYASGFSALARRMMFDTGLGWMPKQCVFTLPDGSRQRYAMHPRSVPDQVPRERVDAVERQVRTAAKPVGITPLAADRAWVGMPDFDGASSGAAYEALCPKLKALPKSGWVVFDLRENWGGSSSWGRRALAALFGDDYATRLADAGGAQKFMVADQATVDMLEQHIASPDFASVKDSNLASLAKIKAAIAAGQRTALMSDSKPGVDLLPEVKIPRPHGRRIAALIDRGCFSSCMNFLQQIRATGDAVVLGEPTIGYSPFGEITRFKLPSGRGAIAVPSAYFRTTQATREPFVPDYPYAGNLADDGAVMKWVDGVLDRVEKLGPPPAQGRR